MALPDTLRNVNMFRAVPILGGASPFDWVGLSDRFTAPKFRLIGDSLVSQNDTPTKAVSGGASTSISRYPRFWSMVSWLTGNAFEYETMLSIRDNKRYGNNSGVGGYDLDEILTHIENNIRTWPEKYIILLAGTNELNSGTSLANMIIKYTAILNKLENYNRIPIILTIPPRNAVDGANDWSATGTTAAQKRSILSSFNQWMKSYARENGIICVDIHSVLVNQTGDLITGFSSDSVHLNGRGSYPAAKEFIRVIGDIFPKGITGQRCGYDAYDATYNPYGNILNGDLSGTGGAFSAGSGAGTVTGTLPDNFQLAKNTSTTTSVAASIVARPDGKSGQAIKLDFTSLGTGSATENWRLNYWTGSSTSLSSWGVSGDFMKLSCEATVVSGHGGVIRMIQPRLQNTGSVTRTATTISFNATTNQILDSANGFGSFLGDRIVVVSGTTNNNKVFYVTSAAAGVLQCNTSLDDIITEAAGASVTVSILANTTTCGASAERWPDVDDTFFIETPAMEMPFTGNLAARFDITIDGTIADTATIYIMSPTLRKLYAKPTALNILADDN